MKANTGRVLRGNPELTCGMVELEADPNLTGYVTLRLNRGYLMNAVKMAEEMGFYDVYLSIRAERPLMIQKDRDSRFCIMVAPKSIPQGDLK